MERKIGEIFEYKGEWYQCLQDDFPVNCGKCCFYNGGFKKCDDKTVGDCEAKYRTDFREVYFKKLEKAGKPYDKSGIMVQKYKVGIPIEMQDEPYMYFRLIDNTVEIEIKNQVNMEENKLNLKPFDLEAAKAGKPVCTRDGRKARIICFDRKGYNMFPIVALIMNDDKESDIYTYRPNGTWDNNGNESDKDLMMIPEKHEGWINIYKSYNDKFAAMTGSIYLYKTEKEAKMEADPDRILSTVKIEWEK